MYGASSNFSGRSTKCLTAPDLMRKGGARGRCRLLRLGDRPGLVVHVVVGSERRVDRARDLMERDVGEQPVMSTAARYCTRRNALCDAHRLATVAECR